MARDSEEERQLGAGHGPYMSVRPAVYADALLVWLFSNEQTAVERGVRGTRFSLPEHLEWWDKRFLSPTQLIYMIHDYNAQPIGFVRYGKCGAGELCDRTDEAEVSIALAPKSRGVGFGSLSLDETSERAKSLLGVNRLVALIRPDNIGSIRTFERSGYRCEGSEKRMGVALGRWVR